MRNTNVPLVCRAWAQLKRAVRIRPTCGVPVGEGQNRTRTGVSAVTSRRAELETAFDAEGVVIVTPTLPPARSPVSTAVPPPARPEIGRPPRGLTRRLSCWVGLLNLR